jgi:NAD(P)H-dependent FMN reductase|tara:strand:+ start:1103 stop:1564 length:462 start_codon:yes stop_codon:yes gene_type:complete
MANLLINIHSPSQNTRRLRDALIEGASHVDIADVTLRVTEPLQATADDVFWADAVILGTTANFGYMSGAMKDFFDRTYETCLSKSEGLPYAIAIRGRSDATGALASMDKIITGLKWRAVQDPLVCLGEFKESFVANWQELGLTVAAGLDNGIY